MNQILKTNEKIYIHIIIYGIYTALLQRGACDV